MSWLNDDQPGATRQASPLSLSLSAPIQRPFQFTCQSNEQAPGIGAPRAGGSAIVNGARQSRSIVVHWTIYSVVLVVVGLVIQFAGFPMNKQLWSPSYVFFMVRVHACVCARVFSGDSKHAFVQCTAHSSTAE